MDENKILFERYPTLVEGFKSLHERRSSQPATHPYIKKSLKRSTFIRSQDKRMLLGKLKDSYEDLIHILAPILT